MLWRGRWGGGGRGVVGGGGGGGGRKRGGGRGRGGGGGGGGEEGGGGGGGREEGGRQRRAESALSSLPLAIAALPPVLLPAPRALWQRWRSWIAGATALVAAIVIALVIA